MTFLYAFFTIIIFIGILISIIFMIYIIEKLKPYYKFFLTDIWYPNRKNKYIGFLNEVQQLSNEEKIKQNKKIQKTYKKLQIITEKTKEPVIEDKLEITQQIADLSDVIKQHIDEMITTEISSYLREYIITEEKYEILKLDEGIKKISENVKNGLSPSLFETPLLYTNEYLYSYIVNQTFTLLLQTVTEYNRRISIGI